MKRVQALPTANAASFAFILAVMWYVGMAQGNGVVYLLFFLLCGVLLVSIPKTFLNLKGLNITADSPKPVFVGQELSLPIELVNQTNRTKFAFCVSLPFGNYTSKTVKEIPAGGADRTVIRFPALRRGIQDIPTLSVSSVYPLGFLNARKRIQVDQQALIYPEPIGDPVLPFSSGGMNSATQTFQPEGDDYAGVRPYQLGEAQRHIDWKAVARGHPLMSKQFSRDEGGALELSFDAVEMTGLEERLSQLALWILSAERAHRPYSLRLPSKRIPAGMGEAHFHNCLRTLACYE